MAKKSKKESVVSLQNYTAFIESIKERIRNVQIKAAVSVNRELIFLYWDIAEKIVAAQKDASWGDNFLENLSNDLLEEFPDIRGFSFRNLRSVRQWYLYWTNSPDAKKLIKNLEGSATLPKVGSKLELLKLPSKNHKNSVCLPEIFGRIPWRHHVEIVTKCKDKSEALFYIRKTLENNWSRSVLLYQVESDLYNRAGKAITNFDLVLPATQSDLARDIIKDPYNFDFLTIREKFDERELENDLIDKLTQFLLELGQGFAFVGRQVKITVGDEDFYPDLLFYHTRLHCYVVIELKTIKFKPEFTGKLNFYVSAIDGIFKSEEDKPTIGILICREKNKTIVEYALKDMSQPIGISSYEISRVLPESFKSSLPTIEDIEMELKHI
ncbi:MAG: PDDEXK nuclease domain-containing protein [Planctomycetaceae bacterium]|jgi:predicted nuclease of restriction endonuclease-like (RecB) superfamily|nr:PDDEXK nuclease domain-containing protein [Planctomycetaceae bacterium]